MKDYIVYQIDAFTKNRFKGNPAGVVVNADGLDESQMQQIARELNNSETAFLFEADDTTCDGIIRYFTPTKEVPTCGHATIAAMYAKAINESLTSRILRYKTQIGILPFEIQRSGDDIYVVMTQGSFSTEEIRDGETVARILNALGLTEEDLNKNCPIQIASTGHSKVMIGIKSPKKLNSLDPAMEELKTISEYLRCNGYFVFVFQPGADILTQGRMFAPAIGITEDPVTGNANGPLGGYLVHNKLVNPESDIFKFKGKQGEKLGRTGIVDVIVKLKDGNPDVIQIAGSAVVVFKTCIEL